MTRPTIAIVACPTCRGMGQFDVEGRKLCGTCAGQGMLVTEPTEPPIVYVTANELTRLAALAAARADAEQEQT